VHKEEWRTNISRLDEHQRATGLRAGVVGSGSRWEQKMFGCAITCGGGLE
jgi:hypothetical protein